MLSNKIKNKVLIIISLILIILGIFLSLYEIYKFNKKNINEEILIKKFYEETITNLEEEDVLEEQKQTEVEEIKQEQEISIDREEYVAIINIPKLNLERGIYSKYSKNNSVNKTVKILKESQMPSEENSNFILASHAGSSSVAYFKNLKDLEIGDYIYIYYNGVKYTYVADKFIEVDKDGEIEIERVKNKKVLTLITCVIGKKKQLVVIANLEQEERYY